MIFFYYWYVIAIITLMLFISTITLFLYHKRLVCIICVAYLYTLKFSFFFLFHIILLFLHHHWSRSDKDQRKIRKKVSKIYTNNIKFYTISTRSFFKYMINLDINSEGILDIILSLKELVSSVILKYTGRGWYLLDT